MFAGSFSMVVGVTVGGGDVTVDMGAGVDLGEDLGDEDVEGTVERGTKELEGLFVGVVLAGRAGPITCRKCNKPGVRLKWTRA